MILKKLVWCAGDERPVAFSYNTVRQRLTVVCLPVQQEVVDGALYDWWYTDGVEWVVSNRRLRTDFGITFEAFTQGCKEATARGYAVRGVKAFERLTR